MNKFLGILIIIVIFSGIFPTILWAENEYWEQRVSLFDKLPVSENDIVFVGNSITDGGEFVEIFNNPTIKNRGISGDLIVGVLKRLRQFTVPAPKKIFLLIGINDISHNLSVEEMTDQYKNLIDSINIIATNSKLYIQSILPVNNDFNRYKGLIAKEDTIINLNKKLKELADKSGNVYINLWPYFIDENNKLDKTFTNDGLHLNGEGYLRWAEIIYPIVNY